MLIRLLFVNCSGFNACGCIYVYSNSYLESSSRHGTDCSQGRWQEMGACCPGLATAGFDERSAPILLIHGNLTYCEGTSIMYSYMCHSKTFCLVYFNRVETPRSFDDASIPNKSRRVKFIIGLLHAYIT